jgi:hypothetical protein
VGDGIFGDETKRGNDLILLRATEEVESFQLRLELSFKRPT